MVAFSGGSLPALVAPRLLQLRDSIDVRPRPSLTVFFSLSFFWHNSRVCRVSCVVRVVRVQWARWEVFFADERYVGLDDKESNYHACNEELFRHVPIPADHIHTIDVSVPLPESAKSYQARTSPCAVACRVVGRVVSCRVVSCRVASRRATDAMHSCRQRWRASWAEAARRCRSST